MAALVAVADQPNFCPDAPWCLCGNTWQRAQEAAKHARRDLVWPCVEHVRRAPLQSREKTWPDYATRAAIAQLGARQTEDLKVPGSIPGLGTFCEAR